MYNLIIVLTIIIPIFSTNANSEDNYFIYENDNKGEKISDSVITNSIRLKFLNNQKLNSFNIHVKTISGKVILTGIISDNKSSNIAVKMIKSINGVRDIDNKLVIQHENYQNHVYDTLLDVAITAVIKAKFLINTNINIFTIKIKTIDKKVILKGCVNNYKSRDKAIYIAKATKGVKEVISQIKVIASKDRNYIRN